MIRIWGNSLGRIPHETKTWAGGEVHVRLRGSPVSRQATHYVIKAELFSSADTFELLLVTDALRRQSPGATIDLVCPYVPYARQDRVVNDGEALSVRVFADIINAQRYRRVAVWDPHSDVTPALIDRCVVRHQYEFVGRIKNQLASNTLLIGPDQGSRKKISAVATVLDLPYVVADKERDTLGAPQVNLTSSGERRDVNVLICDDICDGGRTFIELAKKLVTTYHGSISLYVTHGIFSRGFQPLWDAGIDKIYAANFFPEARRAIREASLGLPDFPSAKDKVVEINTQWAT